MAQALDKFLESIRTSGLPFVAELDAFLAASPSKPKDGEQLARLLVKEKKLTAFQAQELYAGRGKKLVLGNYVILDKLGQGGMGMVLKAEHKRMHRQVALKVLSPAAVGSPDALKRFQREVEAAAKLTHPNIVTAHDADEANGQHFLVMEYVEGSDLSQLVKKGGPLPVDKALHCILQAARGLEFAHSKGVVHRDIKPSNLLLDADGTVKILDMGLARIESAGAEQAELTGTGQIMGTVDYMAPEQAINTRTADARADIYSLGYTLWFLLTGRAAYGGETVMEKLMAHQQKETPSLSAVNAGVSAALEAVFQRMAAKKPAERFQSMGEVIAALERCKSGADVSPTVSLGPSEDNKLSQFLKGFGGGSSVGGKTSAGASATAAPAAKPAVIAAPVAAPDPFEQTLGTASPQTDTDPQTQQHLPAVAAASRTPSPAPPPVLSKPASAATVAPSPDRPWQSDWRVWAISGGGLAGVLVLGLVVWAIAGAFGGGEVPTIVVPNGGTAVLKPGKETTNPTVPGSTKPPLVAAGEPKFALQFDGRSNYVELPDVGLSSDKPFTVEAWVLTERQSTLDGIGVVVSGSSLHIAYEPRVNAWKFQMSQTGGSGPAIRSATRASKEWVHLAAVCDGATRYFFVNGVSQEQRNHRPPKGVSSPILLGAQDANRGGIQDFFAGWMRGVHLSRTARYTANFTPPPRFAADSDTLALYQFDEGAGDVLKDSSGHNHHGKIVGAKWGPAIAPPPTASAPDGAALSFDGVDDYVEIPTLTRATPGPLCLEGWVRDISEVAAVVVHMNGTAPAQIYVGDRHPNGVEMDAADQGGRHVGDPVKLDGRVWTHIAHVIDESESRLYINGKRVASATGVYPTVRPRRFPSAFQFVGTRFGMSQSFPLRGELDEWRISSSARYRADFNPERTLAVDSDTLALYHFDEGTGDVLKDSSGNNHHGKIVGAKWVSAGAALPVPGGKAAGLQFDGDDVVQIRQPVAISPESCTVEAFVQVAAYVPRAVIFSPGGTPSLGLDQTDGNHWRFSFVYAGGGHYAGMSRDPVALNRRSHVAGVGDAGELRIYVDGQLADRQPRNRAVEIPKGQCRIGQFFKGRIDGLRISNYPRYTSDFAAPVKLEADAATVALYRFDEGQGDVLNDSSGNNRHGTIVGAQWRIVRQPWPSMPDGAPQPAFAPFDAEEAKRHQVEWAKFLGMQPEIVAAGNLRMRLIPPGEFQMGSSDGEVAGVLEMASRDGEGWEQKAFATEKPRHAVRITKPFYLGIYEVTQEQIHAFLKTRGDATTALADGEIPIGNVDDEMIVKFCAWLGESDGARYRLPTEAEWEYACRAGTESPFAFGASLSSDQANFNGKFPFGDAKDGPDREAPTPVGKFLPNAFGLFDMHGNMWETCADKYTETAYEEHALNDPYVSWSIRDLHVLRGGDYESSRGYAVRSATRLPYALPYPTVGFRVVREVPWPPKTVSSPMPPFGDSKDDLASVQWSEPENLGPVVNTSARELSPSLTDDELTMTFARGNKFFLARRSDKTKPFEQLYPLTKEINSLPGLSESVSMTGDGLVVVFGATGPGGDDVWLAERSATGQPFGAPQCLSSPVNSSKFERTPVLSSDGLRLAVSTSRGGRPNGEVYLFSRKSRSEPFGNEEYTGPNVNAPGFNSPDWISSDGRTLIVLEMAKRPFTTRVHTRRSTTEEFGPGKALAPPFDTVNPGHCWFSPDCERIYFHARDFPGSQGEVDIWMSRRATKKSPNEP